MSDEEFSRYRVMYKKHGQAEVVMTIDTGPIEQVYTSICSCAGVDSPESLESLEIHQVKDNGEVHVYKNAPSSISSNKQLAVIQDKFPGVSYVPSSRFEIVPVPLQ